MEFSRQEHWSGLLGFLLSGTFPAQISNPCLFCLLHWQADSLPLSHLGRYLPIFWQIKIALLQLGTIYSFFNIFFWFISSLLNSFVRFRVCFIESFISKWQCLLWDSMLEHLSSRVVFFFFLRVTTKSIKACLGHSFSKNVESYIEN